MAKNIYVVGTNDNEYFEFKRLGDGNVQVDVHKMHRDGENEEQIYSRLIKKDETEEFVVYCLGKKDVFDASGSSASSINLRIVGGKGVDVIRDNSTVNGGKSTFVYDKSKKDEVAFGTETKVVKTRNEIKFGSQNLFDYNYNVLLPILGYNTDDGLIGGFSYRTIKRGFGKDEFARNSLFVGTFTSNLNFVLEYETKIKRSNSAWDLVLGLGAVNNDRNYPMFYGCGNEAVKNDELNLNDFYKNKTSVYYSCIGVEKSLWERSSFTPKLKVEYIDVQPNPKTANQETFYDGLTNADGLGSTTLIETEMELDIDLTDNKFIPTSGIRFNVLNNSFYNTHRELGLGGRIDSEATIFTSVGSNKPTTLSIRGGYSYTYGDTPFY